MGLADAIGAALRESYGNSVAEPFTSGVTDEGLRVKVLRHRNDQYPGIDMPGVVPFVITGHASMEEEIWRRWVRECGIPHYGAAQTERMVQHGIPIREMIPTAAFGRQLRSYKKGRDRSWGYLDRVEQILVAIEKWPSLYNLVATEMAEQEFTIQEFVDRVMNLPPPQEMGRGAYTTLGDLLLPPYGSVWPDY